MRQLAIAIVLAACGGGGTDPRVIPGGGIGDGDIDGTLFVHVIDNATDAPLANATVAVSGNEQKQTDANGFVEFSGVDGPQTIAVELQGYRPTVWASANGKNVTIPLDKTTATVAQATLSGSITGWDGSGLPQNHIKGAAVFYSQTDNLGDEGNNLATPNMMNICGGLQACNWTVNVRAGTVTLVAAIIDVDTKGTLSQADDTISIIGWATKTGIVVEGGVSQSGLALDIVEAGNLENITVDYGTPPAALTTKGAFIGIEISDDEVVQLPLLDQTTSTLLAPKPAVFGATSLRLTAVAQTGMGELGAQSIVLRRGLAGPTLPAGEWLTPPVGVSATRDAASWQLVTGAKLHQVQYRDAGGNNLLEITVFDDKATTVSVPLLVALPASGALTARVSGIGATLDLQDFSLEEDEDKLFAIAAQPVQVP